MEKRKRKWRRLCLRLTEADAIRYRRLAKATKRTVSATVRDAVKEWELANT